MPQPFLWLMLAAAVTAAFISSDSLVHMVHGWRRAEYNHGYLIPFVALMLLWQKLPVLLAEAPKPSYLGFALALVLVGVIVIGELSGVYAIVQYGFLMLLAALVLAALGLRGLAILAVPLAYLVFMVPLPSMAFNNLSQSLQLLSSALGVEVIRWFGISVFLEGNVIDLGEFQLHVVDACSGLRYLFPLASFGFLLAALYRGAPWARITIFLAALPITVLMNSLRIGMIGVLVEHWGVGMAEGFLHYFEGWIIFITCLGILFALIWVLHRVCGRDGSALDALELGLPTWPAVWSAGAIDAGRRPPPSGRRPLGDQRPLLACLALLVVVAFATHDLAAREESVPPREPFHRFPLAHQQWVGRESYLAADVVTALDVDDYFAAGYRHAVQELPVDVYIAYYRSQRKGASAHSPRSCIPAGGWMIEELDTIDVATSGAARGSSVAGSFGSSLRVDLGSSLRVNRAVIAKGSARQLVYYWFPQRGRMLTNEYAVKWFLFWDALTRGRSDGALVRLVVPLPDGVPVREAEAHLVRFVNDFRPEISRFVPA